LVDLAVAFLFEFEFGFLNEFCSLLFILLAIRVDSTVYSITDISGKPRLSMEKGGKQKVPTNNVGKEERGLFGNCSPLTTNSLRLIRNRLLRQLLLLSGVTDAKILNQTFLPNGLRRLREVGRVVDKSHPNPDQAKCFYPCVNPDCCLASA
jgi:hypothetical protein